jgi:hypothetical protein
MLMRTQHVSLFAARPAQQARKTSGDYSKLKLFVLEVGGKKLNAVQTWPALVAFFFVVHVIEKFVMKHFHTK